MNRPLPPSPPVRPPPESDPVQLVRAGHRRARLSPLLWALAFMVAAFAGVRAEANERWSHGFVTGWAAACVGAVILCRWLQHQPALTAAAVARRLDRRWKMQARIESALELAESGSELAAEQRRDVAHRLAGRRAPNGLAWYSAVTALAAGLVLNTMVSRPVVAPAGVAPPPSATTDAATLALTEFVPATVPAPPAVPEETPLAPAEPAAVEEPPEDIFAEIKWLEPEPEIKAAALEKVALAAEVTTRRGFAGLTLEISVNGEPRPARPVPAEVLAKLAAAAEARVDFPLHLDDLEVKEYDLVSYFLRAERVSRQPAPPAISPIQFIEIKASPKKQAPKRSGTKPQPSLGEFMQLATAQRSLLRENFTLINTPAPAENAALAGRQEKLAELARQVAAKLGKSPAAGSDDLPDSFFQNLAEARKQMTAAAQKLAEAKNAAALERQHQALVFLIACTRDIMRPGRSQASTAMPPPETLPGRETTAAGRLEALAQKQGELAQEIGGWAEELRRENAAPRPAESVARLVEEQGLVAHEAETLAAEDALVEEARAPTKDAADEAIKAVERLVQNDPLRGLTRAAAAAQHLQEAVRRQENAGRATAVAALEEIRRELNDASRAASPGERTAVANELARQLAAAALDQRQRGSERAADELARVGQTVRPLAGQPDDRKSWRDAALAATEAQVAIAPAQDAVGRVVRQLNRARGGMQGGPGRSSSQGAQSRPGNPTSREPRQAAAEAELAAQLAEVLFTGRAGVARPARQLAEEIDRALRAPRREFNLPPETLAAVAALTELLETTPVSDARGERIRRFDPDAVDPEYRSAVESYFERLSREGSRP